MNYTPTVWFRPGFSNAFLRGLYEQSGRTTLESLWNRPIVGAPVTTTLQNAWGHRTSDWAGEHQVFYSSYTGGALGTLPPYSTG
jgi:hypothetical protein